MINAIAHGSRPDSLPGVHLAHPRRLQFFSLSSLAEERAGGEEANYFELKIPSPQPSPRLGGAREMRQRLKINLHAPP
jgi:hypothetical protein